jgi:hypothetical protein
MKNSIPHRITTAAFRPWSRPFPKNGREFGGREFRNRLYAAFELRVQIFHASVNIFKQKASVFKTKQDLNYSIEALENFSFRTIYFFKKNV